MSPFLDVLALLQPLEGEMLHFSTDYAVMTPELIISCATFDYLHITSVPESGKSILLGLHNVF